MLKTERVILKLLVIVIASVSTVTAGDYALIVGVNDCPQFRLPGGVRPRPLRGAELDADRVATMLIEQFAFPARNVRVLKGESASLADVNAAFVKLQQQLQPGDRFLFYYSGHGTQIADVKPYDEQTDDLDEALCLFDATAAGAGLLRDDQLGLWLDDLPAQNVTVLLDCCHSGTGIKDVAEEFTAKSLPIVDQQHGSRPKTDTPWIDLQSSAKSIDRRLTVFYACQPHQQAYERRVRIDGRFARAGQFTHYLLEAIGGAGGSEEGVVQLSQQALLDAIARRINSDFNKLRTNDFDRQHPILHSGNPKAAVFE